MNRADLLIYIAAVVTVGIALLNAAMLASPDVFNLFAKSGGHEKIVGEEKTWAFQSTVWTAMFTLTIIAILIYLIELRHYPERFRKSQ
ncbi:MAG: hypothetical protein JHC20_05840 [Pyrobaculum sp.]|nr:hypothetical protein [Pyrobaculum sp.]